MFNAPTIKTKELGTNVYWGGGYSTMLFSHLSSCIVFPTLDQPSYQQGVEDGKKDLQAELIKRGKALFNLAMQKTDYVSRNLIQHSESLDITIVEIFLKIEDWDCSNSIIIVKLEDYLSDKIDSLYEKAHALSEEINDESFHWDYSITYHSDSINREKLISDGFHFLYEHSSTPRQTQ